MHNDEPIQLKTSRNTQLFRRKLNYFCCKRPSTQ